MYFLLSGCENPDILSIIYFVKKLIDIACILLPIGLIVFITIDIVKMILAGDDKEVKTNQKMLINRIIFAVAIFFVPTIVTVVMNTLKVANINIDYNSCIANATPEIIAAQREIQEIEDQEFASNIKDNISNSGSNNNSNGNSSNNNNSSNNGSGGKNNDGKGAGGKENNSSVYSSLADEMISVASKEVGYSVIKNDNKYGKELGRNNVSWCGIFVTWVAKRTTVNNTNLYNDVINKEVPIANFASATNSIYTFSESKNLHFYYSNSYGGDYTPKKGDYIYFKWKDKGRWNKKITKGMHLSPGGHVGIVEYVSDGYVHTIEGNYVVKGKHTVSKAKYKLSNDSIIGYGSWYK